MVETLFQVGFILAIVLPPVTVFVSILLITAPRLARVTEVKGAPVHP